MRSLVDLSPFRQYLSRGDDLLTQGLRLARAIKAAAVAERIAEGASVTRPPQVYTVDGWLEMAWRQQVELGALPPRRLLDRVGERWLWQQIIAADLESRGGFRLIRPSGAAEQASQARQQWLMYGGEIHNRTQLASFGLEADCAAFDRWRREFDRKLEQLSSCTRADVYRALLQLKSTEKRPVALCHVLELPPLTRQALEHLAIISAPVPEVSGDFVAIPAARYATRREELSAVAAWAVERHRDESGHTAIVLLDFARDRRELEYFLRQQFDCLGARYAALPVNFSTGMPLSDTPLFRDALMGLRLAGSDGATVFSRSEVLALLRSPFLSGDEEPDGTAMLRLRTALTELMSETIDWRDLTHLAQTFTPESHLARVLSTLATARDTRGRCRPSEWLEVARRQLRLWGWPGSRPLDSLEYQQFERLEASFDDLILLDEVAGVIPFSRFIALWESVLQDRIFQPKTPNSAIQVLGFHEAVGLSFDALWLCGAQSDVLPEPPKLLPFLPVRLQRDLGIPLGDRKLCERRAKTLLNSLRHTHASVRVSCARQQEGVDLLPSILLQLSEASEAAVPAQDSPEHWPQPICLEAIHEAAAEVEGDAVRFGGGAAVLTNQSNCPFRAWITHRLGPEMVAEPAFGLTPAERGTVVHDALRHIWSQLGDSAALYSMGRPERLAAVHTAVQEALGSLESRARRRHRSVRKRVGSACLDLEAERVGALLLDWLALEGTRQGEFRVIEQEDSHELQVGSLTLTLRPDRIDRLSDGRHLVIDYKTGAVKRSSWLGDRPADPQLALYALLDDCVAGLAFGRVHHEGVEYIFLGEDLGLGGKPTPLENQTGQHEDAVIKDWSTLRELWRSRLEDLAEGYTRGEAIIDPLPGACRYCSLGSVCRFTENREIGEDATGIPGERGS